VPALGIRVMEFTEHTDKVLLLDLTWRLRRLQPPVVGLLTEAKHPARHRDRHPNPGTWRGHFLDERVDHFGGVTCTCERYAAARRSTSFSISSSLIRFNAALISRRSSGSVDGVIP